MTTSRPLVRKLRVVAPKVWSHQRGGWTTIIETIQSELHADDGVLFLSAVEDAFAGGSAIEEPWVGFLHQVPLNRTRVLPDLYRLLNLAAWKRSLTHCRGLWVLSEYTRTFLKVWNVPVPVAYVPYATPTPPARFSMEALRGGRARRVVLIGHHLRNYGPFYELAAPGFEKIVLQPAARVEELTRLAAASRDGVTVSPRLSDAEYDDLLSRSVAFLNLSDAAAVSTLVECITRGTPLLVNPLPGVVGYLGETYPLYYHDLDEAAAKLQDDTLLERASAYLLGLDIQAELTPARFVENVRASAIYRSLPTPRSQQTTIRTYDLTVLVCSHSRVDDLRNVLDRLSKQDYQGRFELVLWNNNAARRDEVDDVARAFAPALELKVIHSTENYFCVVRFAMASLMRSDLLMICDDDVLPEPGYLRRFVEAYAQHGPDVVLCATAHTFRPHDFDEEHPERFWQNARLRLSLRERHEECQVHVLHANSCLIPRHVLREVGRYEMEDPEFAVVEDYWLSFILGKYLRIPIRKLKADDVLAFAASAADPGVALWLNPYVQEQRVRLYIHHMRRGWPDFTAPPTPSPGRT